MRTSDWTRRSGCSARLTSGGTLSPRRSRPSRLGAAVGTELLEAFGSAERAVLAAEAEMKDAEDALAAMEHSVTDREKDIQAIRTVCRQAKPGKPGAERRPGLHRRSGGQQLQPPGPRL